jgi:hypothetical protein
VSKNYFAFVEPFLSYFDRCIFVYLERNSKNSFNVIDCSYIELPGDVGKMTLLLPQPPHLLSWTMTLSTDLNVQVSILPRLYEQLFCI